MSPARSNGKRKHMFNGFRENKSNRYDKIATDNIIINNNTINNKNCDVKKLSDSTNLYEKIDVKNIENNSTCNGIDVKETDRNSSYKIDFISNSVNDDKPKKAKVENGKTRQVLMLDDNKFLINSITESDFFHLKELSLTNNGLVELPISVASLKNLESLNLSDNLLENLPTCCKKFAKLKILNISKNKFKQLPKCIQWGIPNLETLDVSENIQLNLDGRIFSNRLKNFYAINNGSNPTIFPKWILSGDITEFDEINFEQTAFKIVDKNFCRTKRKINIKVLNLQQCYLLDRFFCKIMKYVDTIECLKIGNDGRGLENTFVKIPEINKPGSITEMKMNRVGLAVIMADIERFTNLVKFDIQDNNLSYLPDQFCNLKHLEEIIINNNRLIMLPEDIGRMKSLKIIAAAHNNISTLPQSICNLSKIQYIDFYNNNIIELPIGMSDMDLKGLDLEQNQINTCDLKLPASYGELRNKFENDGSMKCRQIGPRIVTPDDSVDSITSDDLTGSSWSSWRNSRITSPGWNDADMDWSEDTDDEWDPTQTQMVPIPSYVPPDGRYIIQDIMSFCPADLHPPSIRDVVRYKTNGACFLPIPSVEGQFDDAESDSDNNAN